MSSEQNRKAKWPTLDDQLKESKVKKGSALEKLIEENQHFAMLRPEEATDSTAPAGVGARPFPQEPS